MVCKNSLFLRFMLPLAFRAFQHRQRANQTTFSLLNDQTMPPKPQVFKSPDGREFTNKSEWRDYMMATFFSFKNKVNEPEPLVRLPGSIEGQMYDISDCENSTLVVLDHSEQVQIDQCKNCRIFIAACASSIFIRNCENCVFYTACRQLRLREVTNSTFYIYSMSEVHIEFSKSLKFAPFNGGYPEHEKHLKTANLDIKHNLWYDIYDHNDSAKTRVNWSLLPEAEYEEPWFPLGACDPAVPRTKPGGVFNPNNTDANMQSFSLEQMVQDAKKINVGAPPVPAPASAATPVTAAPVPPLPPVQTAAPVAAPAVAAPVATACAGQVCCGAPGDVPCSTATEEERVKEVITKFAAFKAGDDLGSIVHVSFTLILPTGDSVSVQDLFAAAPVSGSTIRSVDRLQICPTGCMAFATYWSVEEGNQTRNTAVLVKETGVWRLVHVQLSAEVPV